MWALRSSDNQVVLVGRHDRNLNADSNVAYEFLRLQAYDIESLPVLIDDDGSFDNLLSDKS